MGRRSISSTKAGKFMNPTDQARKEARRKELKKNKKQRLQVRQTVIKQKDPRNIFAEMEEIDRMEFDPNGPPPYNVKVLQEKRRKLKESWLKIYHFYQREDPKVASEYKGMELDYERRRHQMVTIYESVMQAQKVKLDDIPLPSSSMLPPPPPPDELMPTSNESTISATPKSILKPKAANALTTSSSLNKEPPGPPSGSPPSLSEFECDDDQFELGLTADEAYKAQEKPKKIRFDPQPIVEEPKSISRPTVSLPLVSNQPHQPTILNRPLVPISHQPPPPPPQSITQSAQYQQVSKAIQQQQQQMTGSRIVQQQTQSYYQQPPQQHQRHVEPVITQSTTPATIFQAKPVLRNKMAEITRFVPTSLVVKRTDVKKPPVGGLSQTQAIATQQTHGSSQQGPFNYMLQQQQQYATLNPLNTYKSSLSANSNYSSALIPNQVKQTTVPTPIISSNRPTATRIDPKDAAYESFMKEIGKLL